MSDASSSATISEAASSQPSQMQSPFSAWAAQQRESPHKEEDSDTSSVDSLSRHGSASPHALVAPGEATGGPTSPMAQSPRTVQSGAKPAVSQQEKTYAQVVADGTQNAQESVSSSASTATQQDQGKPCVPSQAL